MPVDCSIAIEGNGKRIRLSRGEAEIVFRGKAVSFFLGLIATPFPSYLSRDDLHRLPSWEEMSALSVGKQAARILDKLEECGLLIVEWELKTTAWRLKESTAAAVPTSVKRQAANLLDASNWAACLRFRGVPAQAMARWMRLCGSALVDMTAGEAEAGYEKLRAAYGLTDHEGIVAISDVLATRIGQSLPQPQLPVSTPSVASAFHQAANARRLAAYARASSSNEWKRQYDRLRRELSKMLSSGDYATQAVLFNALAVLARRLGRMDDALDSIREAAALALFSGDLILIQAVSFNFANILTGVVRSGSTACDADDYLDLIGLDVDIRSRLNIGKDSAQAELLAAYLYQERGDLANAKEFLAKAESIITLSRQPLDLALRDRVAGRIQCSENDPDSSGFSAGLATLESAIRRYRMIGNLAAAEETADDLSRYRSRASHYPLRQES